MISSYLHSVIFHILFTTTIGGTSVKFLQINEPILTTCSDKNCNIIQKSDLDNVVKFVREKGPDLILWFSKFKTNATVYPVFKELILQNTTVLPVYGIDCAELSKNEKDCYYLHYTKSNNVPILILNTGFWLNSLTGELATLQINWLEKKLQKFQLKRQKVIIVGYDAPGVLEDSLLISTKYDPKYNKLFVELLKRYSNTISACIFGSEKIDSFRIIMDNNGTPVVPLFIAPTITKNDQRSIINIRQYNYTSQQSLMDNYIQYHRDTSLKSITIKYNYKITYNMKNVHAKQLYEFVNLFAVNGTDNFSKYYKYQIGNMSLGGNCPTTSPCFQCRCRCFILNILETDLKSCISKCSVIGSIESILSTTAHTETFNNPYFRLGVIVGFVVILVGIVVAVNKVYCIRLNRHRNVFLAPLPSDMVIDHPEMNGHISKANGKLTESSENIVANEAKPINGHRRTTNHETEQTYDYIRM